MAEGIYSARVYFIQAGEDGPIKIGISDDPEARRRHLQTASHETLRLLRTMPGGKEAEERLHEMFAGDRIRGEWFRASADLLCIAGHGEDHDRRLKLLIELKSPGHPFARNKPSQESAQ